MSKYQYINARNTSIIIPAFNEEKAISKVLNSILNEIPEIEIIVVDDGSSDNTGKIAAESDVKVIHHDNNYGYGAALKTGIRNSQRDFVLFCDADGQHRVDDIKKLLDICDSYDMIVGMRTNKSHIPLFRRPGKFILGKFANFLAGTKIPDLNSGLRIFRREIILKYLHLMPDGFSFSTTSTFAIMKSKRLYKYVPIKVEKRIGRSTVNQLKHGSQAIMLILRLAVLFEPLKVFLFVTSIIFVLAIVSGIIDLYMMSGLGDLTAILLISTIIIFMTGLLCDQVSALRREKHE